MQSADDRWQFACYSWLGIPPALFGAAIAFYFYGMASLVDSRLSVQEQHRMIVERLFPWILIWCTPACIGLGFFTMCMTYVMTGKLHFRPSFVRVAMAALLLECVPLAVWAIAYL